MSRRRQHWVAVAVAACALVAVFWSFAVSGQNDNDSDPPPTKHGTGLKIHVVDHELGQSIIIDAGETELIFDSGRGNALTEYLQAANIIDGPIDLAVVTHPDHDAYDGFQWLIDSNAFTISEMWDPGFDRPETRAYLKFLKTVQASGIDFKRPLEATHLPSTSSGKVAEIEIHQGVKVTVLHATSRIDNSPPATRVRLDSRKAIDINNASIVSMVTVNDTRILLTGGIYGKDMGDSAFDSPKYVEAKLLELERRIPGILKADLLVAPRQGSELANTQAFIDQVAPRAVIFTGSKLHQLPRRSVVKRYVSPHRILVSTGLHEAANRDHILLELNPDGSIDYRYRALHEGDLEWLGFLKGKPLTERELRNLLGRSPTLPATDRSGTIDLSDADLRGANMRDRDFTDIKLTSANLMGANLSGAIIESVDLAQASLQQAELRGASLNGIKFTGANLDFANLAGASIIDGDLQNVSLSKTVLEDLSLECEAGKIPGIHEFVGKQDLPTMKYDQSPHSLVELRAEAIDKGLREIERDLTLAIEKRRQEKLPRWERSLRWFLFDATSRFGSEPLRPLYLIVGLTVLFAVPYWVVLRFRSTAKIWRVYSQDAILPEGEQPRTLLQLTGISAILSALYFSIASTFNLGWNGISVGTWIGMLQPHDYKLVPTGWARTVRGFQALLSIYLFVLWMLVQFGRPFV